MNGWLWVFHRCILPYSSTDTDQPASVEPSIQWKLLIPVALTSIQTPESLNKWSAADENSASFDCTRLSVMRGRKELARCRQTVWASCCVSGKPSVHRQMSTSSKHRANPSDITTKPVTDSFCSICAVRLHVWTLCLLVCHTRVKTVNMNRLIGYHTICEVLYVKQIQLDELHKA